MSFTFKKKAKPTFISDGTILHFSTHELSRNVRDISGEADILSALRKLDELQWAYYFNRLFRIVRDRLGVKGYMRVFRAMMTAGAEDQMRAYLFMHYDMDRKEGTPEHYAAAMKVFNEKDFAPDLDNIAKPLTNGKKPNDKKNKQSFRFLGKS